MRDDHAHVMQVKLCKANTRGVTIFNTWSYPKHVLREKELNSLSDIDSSLLRN